MNDFLSITTAGEILAAAGESAVAADTARAQAAIAGREALILAEMALQAAFAAFSAARCVGLGFVADDILAAQNAVKDVLAATKSC